MKLAVTTVLKDYCHYAHNVYSKKKKILSTFTSMFLIIVSLFSSNIMYSNPVTYGQTADPVLQVNLSTVTASGNDGNVPSNAFDGNLATRWSDEGVGSFIQADLGSGPLKTITSLEIAWYKGSERNNHFVISTSATGATGSFTTVFSGDSARSNSFQIYNVADTNARYVRVTVNGNTQNDWASINEIRIRGIAGADTTAPTVVSTSPSSVPPEPTGVSATSSVSATFSEPMLQSTVTTSSFTLVRTSDGANVPAVVSYNPNTNTATLDPIQTSLAAGTRYTATITTAVTDLAGNHLQTSKVWSFTVADSGGGTVDQFGITQIYPDKPGGERWFMSANPNNDPRTDPQTTLVRNPDGSWKVRDDSARFNVFTSSLYHPERISTYNQHALATKGYMQDTNDWKNVEMTGVVKFNSGDSSDSWTWYARGGRHYDEGCEGTAYKGDLFYNGRVRIAKEQWHVSYVFSSSTTPSPSASRIGKFVGFKTIMYNHQVGGEMVVTIELWVDRNPDSHTLRNNWEKVYTFTDSGGFGNEGAVCGGDSDQIVTWGGPTATFRWDNAQNVDIKNFSVREIEPPL
jgi:hypothetical protein